MNRTIILPLLLILFSCSAPVAETPRYVEVQGEAEKKFTPDEFYISILLNEEDPARKRSLESMEQSLVKILQEEKIDPKKNLVVTDVSSHFGYWWRKRRGQIYRSRSYELKLPGIKETNAVCQKLEAAGISNFNITRTSHSKIDDLRKEVRAQAVENARDKATYLARAAKAGIGKVISIEEAGRAVNPYQPYAVDGVQAESANQVQLDFMQITLASRTTVRFELK